MSIARSFKFKTVEADDANLLAQANHERLQVIVRDVFLVAIVLVLMIGAIVSACIGHPWVAVFCCAGLWWLICSVENMP